jgi:hypothetical protein
MNKLLGTAFLATAFSIGANAAWADDIVRENRPVDAKVSKIHLGGIIRLNVRQGPTASLVVSGDRRYVSKITTTQRGDTLLIDTENNNNTHFGNNKGNELRADLTVPNLQEFVSEGVGSSEVSGFSGDRLVVSLDGAGAVKVSGQYRDIDAQPRRAAAARRHGRPGHVRPGRRQRLRQDRGQRQPERHGLGHGLRQTGDAQCDHEWIWEGELAVRT